MNKYGTLYGLSLGPGDPDLITRQVWEKLKGDGVWAYPVKKKDAVSYYNRHNPHMRSLNAHNNYCSDWDPNTKLLYIVRDDYLINETINCFSIDDNSVVEIKIKRFKWLK